MNRIAFTLCSNNYLARAKVAGDTFLRHHPDYRFFVFLVDRRDDAIDYTAFPGLTVVPIADVVADIEALAAKYNVMELNTSVKPAVFLHLFRAHAADSIIYVDPDVMILSRFEEVETILGGGTANIVITPHGCSPIDDGKIPSEVHLTIFGTYNLGFLAVANTSETMRFLEWWHDRLMKYCYIRTDEGLFTDQIWINYAPAFFDGVFILKHRGYNVAHWNLYEREVACRNSVYHASESEPLRFFHFSHYDVDAPYLISRKQNRHTVDDFESLRELITTYQAMLVANRHEFFRRRPYRYAPSVPPAPEPASPPRSVLRRFLSLGYRAGRRIAPAPAALLHRAVRTYVDRLRS